MVFVVLYTIHTGDRRFSLYLGSINWTRHSACGGRWWVVELESGAPFLFVLLLQFQLLKQKAAQNPIFLYMWMWMYWHLTDIPTFEFNMTCELELDLIQTQITQRPMLRQSTNPINQPTRSPL